MYLSFLFLKDRSMTAQELDQIKDVSGIDGEAHDFLDEGFRLKCKYFFFPDLLEMEPRDCREAFIYLKENFEE